MEAKTKTKKTTSKKNITEAYKDFVLTEGKIPVSVFQLSKRAGFAEETFYSHFSNLSAVESEIWIHHLERTVEAVRQNGGYSQFSGREKLLLFFFTFTQELRNDRSFVSWSASNWARPGKHSRARSVVAGKVKSYFDEVLSDAISAGEIQDRSKLSNHYSDGLMLTFWFILDFWIKDESPDFEDSDALIEKTMGLALDLLAQSPLEKAFDLGKFLLGRMKMV